MRDTGTYAVAYDDGDTDAALRPAAIRSLEAVDPNLTCNVCGSGDGADSMLLCDNFCAGGCPSSQAPRNTTPDCATKAAAFVHGCGPDSSLPRRVFD